MSYRRTGATLYMRNILYTFFRYCEYSIMKVEKIPCTSLDKQLHVEPIYVALPPWGEKPSLKILLLLNTFPELFVTLTALQS